MVLDVPVSNHFRVKAQRGLSSEFYSQSPLFIPDNIVLYLFFYQIFDLKEILVSMSTN